MFKKEYRQYLDSYGPPFNIKEEYLISLQWSLTSSEMEPVLVRVRFGLVAVKKPTWSAPLGREREGENEAADVRGFPEKGRSLWGSSIYDVRKFFWFLDPLPPQNSRNLVPFVCFVGTRSPSHCGRQIWKPLALIALPSVPEISLSSSQTGIELDLDFFLK